MKLVKDLLPEACYWHDQVLRPEGVIIHAISAVNLIHLGATPCTYDDIRHIFLADLGKWASGGVGLDDAALRSSAHELILRDGTVYQLVPENRKAWHAGTSELNGRGGCNHFTVGIELAGVFPPFGTEIQQNLGYTPAQYAALSERLAYYRDRYGITSEWVAGHEKVSPGRKTDPGPHFDWSVVDALF